MVESPHPVTPEGIKAQRLMNSWNGLRDTVPSDAKDRIGALYIELILELGGEKAEQFIEGVRSGGIPSSLWHEVGMAQAAISPSRESISRFWASVRELEPLILPTQEDLAFAAEQDDSMGAAIMLWSLVDSVAQPSSVLQELRANAHSYK